MLLLPFASLKPQDQKRVKFAELKLGVLPWTSGNQSYNRIAHFFRLCILHDKRVNDILYGPRKDGCVHINVKGGNKKHWISKLPLDWKFRNFINVGKIKITDISREEPQCSTLFKLRSMYINCEY